MRCWRGRSSPGPRPNRPSIASKVAEDFPHDAVTGYQIVLRAARAPLEQIADNAGADGGVVVNKVTELDAHMGYDALSDRYVDMVKSGIIDPTKVVRTALQNAASVATLLLTSDALVAEIPKKKKNNGRK